MQHQDKELSSTLQMKMILGEERIEPIGAPHLPEFYFFYYKQANILSRKMVTMQAGSPYTLFE
ncbi:MAG: hypothetical protein MJE68_02970 [Proteobacteria bacterium]|nr:hypothetical protein [Pseudomonadota bacterium]